MHNIMKRCLSAKHFCVILCNFLYTTRRYIYIYMYIYIYIIVFPNRIENDRNGKPKQLHQKARSFLLCSWLCGCVSVRCQSHPSQLNFTEVLKCSGGVTRQNPPKPAGAFGSREEKTLRFKVGEHHCIRKSAATTWLQRTLGGMIIGLTTFWISG